MTAKIVQWLLASRIVLSGFYRAGSCVVQKRKTYRKKTKCRLRELNPVSWLCQASLLSLCHAINLPHEAFKNHSLNLGMERSKKSSPRVQPMLHPRGGPATKLFFFLKKEQFELIIYLSASFDHIGLLQFKSVQCSIMEGDQTQEK